MKTTMVLIFLLSTFAFSGEWLSNFDEAKTIASKEDKMILLYFSGSDWCRPCILLKKKVFETDEFKEFAGKNLVLSMFDFPFREKNMPAMDQVEHNEKMAEQYNPDGNFPQVVIVNSKGAEIVELAGYNNESVEDYITNLKKVLKVD